MVFLALRLATVLTVLLAMMGPLALARARAQPVFTATTVPLNALASMEPLATTEQLETALASALTGFMVPLVLVHALVKTEHLATMESAVMAHAPVRPNFTAQIARQLVTVAVPRVMMESVVMGLAHVLLASMARVAHHSVPAEVA